VTEIETFLRRLPKAELHLHLEGAITPATLLELSARRESIPLTPHQAESFYQFDDFRGFLDGFRHVTKRLVEPEDYELVAWRMIEGLHRQGVVHAEVFVSVGVIYMWRNFDPYALEPIFEALERARLRGERELGVSLYWIFDAVRHFAVREAEHVFRKAAQMRERYPSIIGVGLGGDERERGSEPFRHIYAEAREAGLRLTNHAGETTGPEAIWEALAVGSERLGHVLSAIQDPALIQELKARQLPLELNPTSNCVTGVCPAFQDHPLRKYFDAGLLVSLNSDDPAFFGSDAVNEYLLAHQLQHFTKEELRSLAANSFRSSFLPEAQKQAWIARVESAQ
jgi:aminodeoxyfutalosine deaminase